MRQEASKIIAAACNLSSISIVELRSKSKRYKFLETRMLITYVLRERGMAYASIAELLGRKRVSIYNTERKSRQAKLFNPKYRAKLNKLKTMI